MRALDTDKTIQYRDKNMKKSNISRKALLDPDGINQERADWAFITLAYFKLATGTDSEDAVKDLLCDLMHYCQQTQGEDFDVALDAARRHYLMETTTEVQ
jgi:hypothetical protein